MSGILRWRAAVEAKASVDDFRGVAKKQSGGDGGGTGGGGRSSAASRGRALELAKQPARRIKSAIADDSDDDDGSGASSPGTPGSSSSKARGAEKTALPRKRKAESGEAEWTDIDDLL